MFDPSARNANDDSDTDLGTDGRNSQNKKTTLDSYFDEMLKEAKKKKVNKKKNAVKPCSNDFFDFQRDQFSYQK